MVRWRLSLKQAREASILRRVAMLDFRPYTWLDQLPMNEDFVRVATDRAVSYEPSPGAWTRTFIKHGVATPEERTVDNGAQALAMEVSNAD